jgi:hypothetical protein
LYYLHCTFIKLCIWELVHVSICITLICIVLLTLYIYEALFLGVGFCSIRCSTLYCYPVVDVSYVVNGEIKRPCRIITICCIQSWWLNSKVFTFTILSNKEQCDICITVAISYWTPGWINTTVKWLPAVSGNIYGWVWIQC